MHKHFLRRSNRSRIGFVWQNHIFCCLPDRIRFVEFWNADGCGTHTPHCAPSPWRFLDDRSGKRFLSSTWKCRMAVTGPGAGAELRQCRAQQPCPSASIASRSFSGKMWTYRRVGLTSLCPKAREASMRSPVWAYKAVANPAERNGLSDAGAASRLPSTCQIAPAPGALSSLSPECVRGTVCCLRPRAAIESREVY